MRPEKFILFFDDLRIPAGITAKRMISLYLKKAAQTQIPLTNPAGG